MYKDKFCIEPFSKVCWFIVADTPKDVNDFFSRDADFIPTKEDEILYAEVMEFNLKGIWNIAFVLYPRGLLLKDDVLCGLIVHEINHIKNKMYSFTGIKPKLSNDENESYFLEYLFNKILKLYRKYQVIQCKLIVKEFKDG